MCIRDRDTGNCLRLWPLVPRSVLFVAESGVRTAADIDRLRAGGVDAVLVGELSLIHIFLPYFVKKGNRTPQKTKNPPQTSDLRRILGQ